MNRLPVTLLFGLPGAGKTILLNDLLAGCNGHRVAVLSTAPGEKRLRTCDGRDLADEVTCLARGGQYDYLFVELSGASTPLPVAETFLSEAPPGGALAAAARLDTLVSVVDAGGFLPELQADVPLKQRGPARDEDDARTAAEVLIHQVEFADVIVLNKMDTVDSAEGSRVEAALHRLNPRAQLLQARRGCVPRDRVMHTGLFDFDAACEASGWLQAMRGEHTTATEEHGVTSFVYRARQPFHPGRFYLFLRMSWPGVLRSKGVFWLASHPGTMWVWSQAGQTREYVQGGAWLAALPQESWPNEHLSKKEIERIWDAELGDRRQEIAFIGIEVREDALRQGLDWCLMTDEEMQAGTGLWQDDPFMANVFV